MTKNTDKDLAGLFREVQSVMAIRHHIPDETKTELAKKYGYKNDHSLCILFGAYGLGSRYTVIHPDIFYKKLKKLGL